MCSLCSSQSWARLQGISMNHTPRSSHKQSTIRLRGKAATYFGPRNSREKAKINRKIKFSITKQRVNPKSFSLTVRWPSYLTIRDAILVLFRFESSLLDPDGRLNLEFGVQRFVCGLWKIGSVANQTLYKLGSPKLDTFIFSPFTLSDSSLQALTGNGWTLFLNVLD